MRSMVFSKQNWEVDISVKVKAAQSHNVETSDGGMSIDR